MTSSLDTPRVSLCPTCGQKVDLTIYTQSETTPPSWPPADGRWWHWDGHKWEDASSPSSATTPIIDAEGLGYVRQYVRDMKGVLQVLGSSRMIVGSDAISSAAQVEKNIARVEDYLRRTDSRDDHGR